VTRPIDRRDVLKGGMALLALLPLGCGPDDTGTSCDGAPSTSTSASGHVHTLCVPLADLESPPVTGATYTSSSTSGHTHDVALTQDDLSKLAGGDTITKTSTSSSGHTHDFAITRA
jgi:hypothetical protein